ncbi:MAG: CoA transferase, partial [Planktomarina sp.]
RDVLRASDLEQDARFATNAGRVTHRDDVDGGITAISQTLSRDEFRKRLRQAGIAYGAINSVDDLGQHPALRRRDVVTDQGAALTMPASPIRWQDRPVSATPHAAPKIGAHTASIKREFGK